MNLRWSELPPLCCYSSLQHNGGKENVSLLNFLRFCRESLRHKLVTTAGQHSRAQELSMKLPNNILYSIFEESACRMALRKPQHFRGFYPNKFKLIVCSMILIVRVALAQNDSATSISMAPSPPDAMASTDSTTEPSFFPSVSSSKDTSVQNSSPTLSPSLSNIPSTSATMSAWPTASSRPSSAPTSVYTFPTSNPSLTSSLEPSFALSQSPSDSSFPSFAPSFSSRPSLSSKPSYTPSISSYPSSTPTTAQPSAGPTVSPTISPIIAPSSAPSLTAEVSASAQYLQTIMVSVQSVFDEDQAARFQFLYQRYTQFIGYNVSDPEIITKSTILNQNVGQTEIKPSRGARRNYKEHIQRSLWRLFIGYDESDCNESKWKMWVVPCNLGRKLQDTTTSSGFPLSIRFSMRYETRFSYDLEEYPELFKQFVNSNLTRVAEDLARIGLPVVSASPALIFTGTTPTNHPTSSPAMSPTNSPVLAFPSLSPSSIPTSLPSLSPSFFPSVEPSIEPTLIDRSSFVIGLSLGLSGVFVLAALAFVYVRHLERNAKEEQRRNELRSKASAPNNIHGEDHPSFGPESPNIDVKDDIAAEEIIPAETDLNIVEAVDPATVVEPTITVQQPVVPDVESGTSFYKSEPAIHPFDHGTLDSIFSVTSPDQSNQYASLFASRDAKKEPETNADVYPGGNFMMHDASFSSEENDGVMDPFQLDGSHDELDNYKNQDVEILRSAVEESVDNVEGMMSLAVTRALTEPEGTDLDVSWSGALDPGSVEACCLLETYDWAKTNANVPIDSRYEYFQETLIRIVLSVLMGLIGSLQGAQLIHNCATILGLPLLKELPMKTLIITNMIKTEDLSEGHVYIADAFKSFGKIEDAAIAPNKRGFGFVRFVHAKSVELALEKNRMSPIEIQDKTVFIKTIKPEFRPY